MMDENIEYLRKYGENTDKMKASFRHLVESIKFQREMSEIQGKQISVYPRNMDDISVGDMVYVQLEVNYPNELWYGHWCYVLKDAGSKMLVAPCTSIKKKENDRYTLIIDTVVDSEITQSRMILTEIRFIDKQRIDQRKPVGKVLTPKSVIRKRIFEFLEEE